MIEVRLFGNLRQNTGDEATVAGAAIYLPAARATSVGEVLAELGIDAEAVGNVFLNGRLLPRSPYPITLGYPLAANRPLAAEDWLTIRVRAGDRVGIFPRTMSLVVV